MMKVVFISNYINHHQIPFSNALYKRLGNNYCFIETIKMEEERVRLGWNANNNFPYLLKSYESDQALRSAQNLVDNADVVILGGISGGKWLNSRKEKGRLTFIYSERIYKQGLWKIISKSNRETVKREYADYQHHNFYLLSASAYFPYEMSLYNAYNEKIYKWGYFPQFKEFSSEKKKTEIDILWVGRFIDWKHPELFVKLIELLKSKSYSVKCKMIGTGPLLPEIKKYISDHHLVSNIELCGSMSADKVRTIMEESRIFITTSDYQEGWGAVVNEAMNSRCVVIASHAMGAVPYLIKHGYNGLIFKSNNVKSLLDNTEKALNDTVLQSTLSNNAYETIKTMWNADFAAERILMLSESLLSGEKIKYLEGPCSKAPVVKQWRMYKEVVKEK